MVFTRRETKDESNVFLPQRMEILSERKLSTSRTSKQEIFTYQYFKIVKI
jgi:hypothetical protein